MKKLFTLFFLSYFITIWGYSQCTVTANQGTVCQPLSSSYWGEMLPNNGCGNFASYSPFGPGQYFRMPVLQGGCYVVSTCGNSMDTQISLFQATTTATAFAWVDDNGPICSGASSSIRFSPGFSDYVRVNVNQFNCLPGGTSSITVNVRQENNLSITSSNTNMCQGQVRTLTATPVPVASAQPNSGNLGTFSGTGVSGSTFTAPTPAGASGIYTVTYTFGYCSTTQNITVYRNPTISNAGSNFNAACGATTATLAGNTPTYGTGVWTVVSGTGTATSPSSPTSGVTGLTPGGSTTFRWTITNGPCTASYSDVTISVPLSPIVTASISPNDTICAGGMVTLTGGGAFSYSWAGPGSPTNGIPFTALSSATYTVTGTAIGGCTSTATQDLIVLAVPTVNASISPNDTVCQSSLATLTGSGAASYLWSGPGSPSNGVPFAASTSGTYTVTGTGANGCTGTATQSLTVNTSPTITASVSPNDTVCGGDMVTLTGSGGISYTWSGGVVDNTPFVAATSATYTVTGTNTSGCTNTATQSLVVNSAPVLSVTISPNDTVCDGTSVTLTGSGGSSLNWSGGITNGSPFIASATATYTLSGNDSINGCPGSTDQTITVNALPNVTFNNSIDSVCSSSSPITLNGGSPGGGTLSGTGVSGSNFDPSSLPLGFYTITYDYIDGNGCANSAIDSVLVSACLGIEEIGESSILLYPNPNTGQFYLSVQNDFKGFVNFYIIDMQGKMIYRSEVNKETDTLIQQVDISEEAPGVYFVNILFEGGQQISKRIVKK